MLVLYTERRRPGSGALAIDVDAFAFTLPLLGNISSAPVLTCAFVDIEITAVLLGHFTKWMRTSFLGKTRLVCTIVKVTTTEEV